MYPLNSWNKIASETTRARGASWDVLVEQARGRPRPDALPLCERATRAVVSCGTVLSIDFTARHRLQYRVDYRIECIKSNFGIISLGTGALYNIYNTVLYSSHTYVYRIQAKHP